MKSGPIETRVEFAVQCADVAEDDGWRDEQICETPKQAVFACFDARQKTHRLKYRAIMRLEHVISPAENLPAPTS